MHDVSPPFQPTHWVLGWPTTHMHLTLMQCMLSCKSPETSVTAIHTLQTTTMLPLDHERDVPFHFPKFSVLNFSEMSMKITHPTTPVVRGEIHLLAVLGTAAAVAGHIPRSLALLLIICYSLPCSYRPYGTSIKVLCG
jgi:hypothetical protein